MTLQERLVAGALLIGVLTAMPAFAQGRDDDCRELVLHNGKIVTLDARNTMAASVTIRNGVIAAVGVGTLDALTYAARLGLTTHMDNAGGWPPRVPGAEGVAQLGNGGSNEMDPFTSYDLPRCYRTIPYQATPRAPSTQLLLGFLGCGVVLGRLRSIPVQFVISRSAVQVRAPAPSIQQFTVRRSPLV